MADITQTRVQTAPVTRRAKRDSRTAECGVGDQLPAVHGKLPQRDRPTLPRLRERPPKSGVIDHDQRGMLV